MSEVRRAGWAELDPQTLHDLLTLRIDVFVVEQGCPYRELDGRDVEPGAQHWHVPDAHGRPAAYLRTLEEPDGDLRVGRVCTRGDARGRGLAGQLVRAVLEVADAAEAAVVLEAQAHLSSWYAAFGFTISGAGYEEDGIAHVPMRHEPPNR